MTLNEIYANVPTEQVERLKQFRLSHQCRYLTVDNVKWEYLSCGQGEQTLLLLPGALSTGESLFPIIQAFEIDYRVIAPSYTLSSSMTGLCDGIARILEVESVDQANVMGGSYGGLVAQYFVRRHRAKVRRLVLSHTFVPTQKLAKPLWIAGKVFGALPGSLFVPLLKIRLNRMLVSTLRAANHPETEFWQAYLNEAIDSGLLKQVFIHQNQCLIELLHHNSFTADDLMDWNGKILIIDSDDDPAISAGDRELLRGMYPRAKVHTFRDAGHASSILKREEVVRVVENFIGKGSLAS
jgi:pimeloyl-ACP methyl ester carboxylesterase